MAGQTAQSDTVATAAPDVSDVELAHRMERGNAQKSNDLFLVAFDDPFDAEKYVMVIVCISSKLD